MALGKTERLVEENQFVSGDGVLREFHRRVGVGLRHGDEHVRRTAPKLRGLGVVVAEVDDDVREMRVAKVGRVEIDGGV